MGIDARRGLALWAEEARASGLAVDLIVRDDRGEPVEARRQVHDLLVREEVDLLAGPYSSGLTRAVAPIADARGVVLWNHGGAADDIHRHGHRTLVGILTPASRYLVPAVRWMRYGSVLILRRARSGFSAAVAAGAEAEARRQGRAVQVEPYPAIGDEVDAFLDRISAAPPALLLGAGRLGDDIALALALRHRRLALPTALVAVPVRAFRHALGAAADGFVGPSQWEATARITPDLGPTPRTFARRFEARYGEHPDYPAAQAYAAGLVMGHCLEIAGGVDQERLRAAAAALDRTTLLGRFRIDPDTGMQIGHEMLLVGWARGTRRVIHLLSALSSR
jgi:branched-chain amino acid transport system substrate-binding protein